METVSFVLTCVGILGFLYLQITRTAAIEARFEKLEQAVIRLETAMKLVEGSDDDAKPEV